ncbi:MAG: NADH:flavin oxidoreductase/NADH oxidase [Actinomycetota bacterium]|nr:NADH:flavin oxidoreductase/NADH oxidase [Actinomycetota bacterium]
MTLLFSPLTIRGVEFPNRAWLSPMCQYSAVDGIVGDWHLVTLGAYATGKAGLVMAEATGVLPQARISPDCPGIWNQEQVTAWARVVDFIHTQSVKAGIQLAHAGRKGSMAASWNGGKHVSIEDGGWSAPAPSALAFEGYQTPHEMTVDEIHATTKAFAEAAVRAHEAGFDVVEIHAAHGYLLHQFLSPLSNERTDEYGGSLENRMRFPIAVAAAVRAAFPEDKPVFVRISATDWVEGGWDVEQSVMFVKELDQLGIDLIDTSSGGSAAAAEIPNEVNYQIDLAEQIRAHTGILTGAVGRITEAEQAELILASGKADVVFLARQMLRDPHWPLRAAHELGERVRWAKQMRGGASWVS